MDFNLRKLNQQIDNGILPSVLDFSLQNQNKSVDMDKLKYNAFYRTYEFVEKRFPPGHQDFPGFDKIIEDIAQSLPTPLEEMIIRQEANKE